MSLKLLRKVQGWHERLGLADVIKIAAGNGATQILEVQRHRQDMLQPLLEYMDEVVDAVDAVAQRNTEERFKPQRLRRMWKDKSKGPSPPIGGASNRRAGGAS